MTRTECARCSVPYNPRLTRGCCPVCGTSPAGASAPPRRWADTDDRLLVLTVAATIANALLLGGLAVVALH